MALAGVGNNRDAASACALIAVLVCIGGSSACHPRDTVAVLTMETEDGFTCTTCAEGACVDIGSVLSASASSMSAPSEWWLPE